MNRVWKQPAEERAFSYDFSASLGVQTIASIISADSLERSGTGTLDKLSEGNTSTLVQIIWGGGADGKTYRTTVKVRDTANQEHELDGEIFVSDVRFTLPTGIAATYLTGEEYVERFGFEETVRLTDEERKGTIDGPALMAALSDASQFADSYVAVRYPLPLAEPIPEVLKQVVADLARERLHKTKPTPMVSDNANRARSTLRDISQGRATLVLEAGEVVDASPSASPQWAANDPATIFNPDKLAGF